MWNLYNTSIIGIKKISIPAREIYIMLGSIFLRRTSIMHLRRKVDFSALLLIIMALASIIVYQNYRFMEERRVLLENLMELSLTSLITLTDNINMLIYAVEYNSTGEDTVRIILKTAEYSSRTLGRTAVILYEVTGAHKHLKWHTIFANIGSFSVDLANDEPGKTLTRLKKCMERLEKINDLLKEVIENYHGDLNLTPDATIDNILSMTENLLA
ncbi:MAG: hypothetical protein QXN24_01860 [Candidatus Bathyarchaeia archaeon]